MSTIFISDLHLSENFPEVTLKLREFLAKLPADIEAIYILGDLFEVWIGDDAATSFQLEIAKLFKAAAKLCPIYFMAGNRDFLIGKQFCQKSGFKYLPDLSVISLYGTNTLLTHGDSLCTQDKFFQFYRKIVHSKLFKILFLSLPLGYRNKIASTMRERSKHRNQRISSELMDINQATLKKFIKKYQCDQVIYGHTHRPGISYLDVTESIKKVYVLSDWHQQGNTLIFNNNHLNKLNYF